VNVLLAPPFAFLDMMLLGDREECLLPIDNPSVEEAQDAKSNNEITKEVTGPRPRRVRCHVAPSIEAATDPSFCAKPAPSLRQASDAIVF